MILHKHAAQRKVQCPREPVEYNLHMPSDTDYGRDAHVPLLIVISGPSGAGKDSVMQRMQQRGLKFHFVTTATTRPRRSNEVHGRDYWFVTQAEFARMIDQDELMEHALVYGDYKGVPKQEVRQALESGQDVVMRLDVQGAETSAQAGSGGAVDLHHHGQRRGPDQPPDRNAARRPRRHWRYESPPRGTELRQVDAFDYIIVNHDEQLDHTVDMVQAIIEAEHHRVRQRQVSL